MSHGVEWLGAQRVGPVPQGWGRYQVSLDFFKRPPAPVPFNPGKRAGEQVGGEAGWQLKPPSRDAIHEEVHDVGMAPEGYSAVVWGKENTSAAVAQRVAETMLTKWYDPNPGGIPTPPVWWPKGLKFPLSADYCVRARIMGPPFPGERMPPGQTMEQYWVKSVCQELTGYSMWPELTGYSMWPTRPPVSKSRQGPVRSIMGVPEGEFDPDDGDLGRVTRMPPSSSGGAGPSVPFEDEEPREKVEKRRKVKGLGEVEWLGLPMQKPKGFRCRWNQEFDLFCGYEGIWYNMGNYNYRERPSGSKLWNRYLDIDHRRRPGKTRPDLGF